jgi:transketolase
LGWERYVGPNGKSIGIDQYGASAPMEVLAEKYGFSVENVVHVSKQMLGRS